MLGCGDLPMSVCYGVRLGWVDIGTVYMVG